MFKYIKEDIESVLKYDPSAPGKFTIFMTYPGVHALRKHRKAHRKYNKGKIYSAYRIAARSRRKTGIEIHPAVKMGRRVFIDHGIGIVIGETSVIGNDVIIFQGVTFGSNTFDKIDRHPKVGNNVILYVNATLIGPITIGDNSIVGAGAIVLKSSPNDSVLVGAPARNLKDKSENEK